MLFLGSAWRVALTVVEEEVMGEGATAAVLVGDGEVAGGRGVGAVAVVVVLVVVVVVVMVVVAVDVTDVLTVVMAKLVVVMGVGSCNLCQRVAHPHRLPLARAALSARDVAQFAPLRPFPSGSPRRSQHCGSRHPLIRSAFITLIPRSVLFLWTSSL
ncbi:hypothetical protein R5R35_005210 [Gryllus longicercus]|uniref:Uncharacterized protein n=1 Tax=Gryllus longicercus TaxID=2509291 RepID=A0AAN9Z0S8_9ORTH